MGWRKALLLINPFSREGEKNKEEAIRILRDLPLELIVPELKSPEEFSPFILQYHQQVDLVIVGGGDGSMGCAIKGLEQTQLPLAVLPLGTANNLARNLSIPLDLKGACQQIMSGVPRKIDLGQVNNRYFFNVAGIGLSTVVNSQIPSELKKRWGPLAYVFSAIKAVKNTRPFTVKVDIPGEAEKVYRSLQVTVCNGKHYGAGMVIQEEAQIDDARLDLFIMELNHWWEGLRFIPGLMKGSFKGQDQTTEGIGPVLFKEAGFTLKTKRPMPIDTDGEITTRTPAVFSVHPQAITVVAPGGVTQ